MNKDQIDIPITWANADAIPVELATHFLIQNDKHGFYLVMGNIPPPPVSGTADQQLEQYKKIKEVGVRAAGRFFIPTKAMDELVNLLQNHLSKQPRT